MEDVQNTALKNCVLMGRHRTSYKAVNLNGVGPLMSEATMSLRHRVSKNTGEGGGQWTCGRGQMCTCVVRGA